MNFNDKKRIVIKVGTSTLAYSTGNLNLRRVSKLIEVFSDIKNSGKEIVFVTSGAIGVGVGKSGLTKRPADTPTKQACAAIGQSELMNIYDNEFGKHNHTIAQILLTRDVISNAERKNNVKNTFEKLFELGAIPIINANDSVSIAQLDFDENDTLSAMVAQLCGADLLIILTDVDGLYDGDPKNPDSRLIESVEKITPELISVVGQKGSELASGGMLTKLEAADIATNSGIDTVIINGENPEILYDLLDGKAKFTHFKAKF
ncbi:MAG: glutamate 5-kinase [Clostridiales bacterium]|nr:glutamate 5-kinase [Clostridiales bacterium]